MRVFGTGARGEPTPARRRLLTVPNLLSLARLLALPLVVLDLAGGRHLRALVVLGLLASTDWLDGYLARRLDQVSRLGILLDPLSDRLLVAAAGVGLILADLLPLWAVAVLLARDALLLIGAVGLLLRGEDPPPVTRLGKAATFVLMLALPLFILTGVLSGGGGATPSRWSAWLLYGVGAVLYYGAGVQYTVAAVRLLRGAGDTGRLG